MRRGQKIARNPAKSGHNDTKTGSLTPSQERAIAALLESRSIVAAARQANVSERSLRRWLRENQRFQAKLRELREEALAQASLRLQQGAPRAIETLYELISSKTRIESGRASLVRTAIDFAFRSGSYSDLADRITALENSGPPGLAPHRSPEEES